MNEFCITCANGIEYKNFEDFIDKVMYGDDDLITGNYEYLNNYIWRIIEETKGDIPPNMLNLMEEIDFIQDYQTSRQLIDFDIYKGWSNEIVILCNPTTKNYYGIYCSDYQGTYYEYEEPLFQVRKTEEVVTVWKTVGDVDDDKSVEVKILKDYLKQAVKDLNRSSDNVDFCEHSCHNCLHDINNDCTHGCRYKWKYTNTVEKMLGERIE